MTDRDQMSENHECGADAAAYALGALEPSEAEAFREHLASCAVCRDEVASFEQVTGVLPMSASQHDVPKALRRRVLHAVRSESNAQGAASRSPRRFPARLLPRPVMAAAVVLALALITLGTVELIQGGAGATRVIQASVGSAQLRLADNRGELVVRDLQPPPSGRIYELWLQHGNRLPSPSGVLFSVTSSGMAYVAVPGSLRGVSVVMVTQEPAGGSPAPTSPPVIVARVD